MKKFFSCLLIYSIFLLMISCGKKGPIYPPLIRKPQKIETFSAFQRGREIILEWTNPTTYIDGEPLDVGVAEVEIWLITGKEEKEKAKKEDSQESLCPYCEHLLLYHEELKGESEEESKEEDSVIEEAISEQEFLNKARAHLILEREKFLEYLIEESEEPQIFRCNYPLTQENFLARTYTFGLRVRDGKDRESEFSSFLAVRPQPLPLPPGKVKCEVHPDHILVRWDSPWENIDGSYPANVKGFDVYRGEEDGHPQKINHMLIKGNRFQDAEFTFGKTYHYFIRASATKSSPYLQSGDSEVIVVEAKDTFPPVAPTGLVMIRSEDFISLSWDANPEKDLVGYRVWRREKGEGEYILLTPDPIRENTFTDSKIEKDKKYEYRITALDQYDNESDMSESISDIMEDGVP